MSSLVNHLELYRLPWNLTDNAISWLEPTAQCNLACDGCYRDNRAEHKSMDEIRADLDAFQRQRRADTLSIAGGDPLLYPHLCETVAEARKRGFKVVVNTNGKALTSEYLKELKQAGVNGFTFHVDSKQGRPGKWRGKNEIELCDLRDELVEMAAQAEVGVAFNATVYPDTLQHVGALARWAERRMDRVQVMVFILYRDMPSSRFRFFAGEKEVTIPAPDVAPARAAKKNEPAVYNLDSDRNYDHYLTTDDVIAALRREWPGYRPAAYLNGTEDPRTFKWLIAGRMGRPGETMGWVGPRLIEVAQTAKHLATGNYLAYVGPWVSRRAEPVLLLAPLDRGVRRIAGRFVASAARRPSRMLAPFCFQTLVVIQPIDVLADGRMNMCDGCPDMTVYRDQLVWSCRMDEQERYGRNLRAEAQS